MDNIAYEINYTRNNGGNNMKTKFHGSTTIIGNSVFPRDIVAVMYLAVCTVKYLVPGDPDCGEFCGRLGGFRL